MRESVIEAAIRKYAISRGMLVYKFTSPGKKGVPDRMFITRKGTVWFMEIKAPGKKPTALQERELSLMAERGVTAWWTDNIMDGVKRVDNMENR